MPVFNNILAGASAQGGDLGEPINQSIRFRDGQRLVSSNTMPSGNFTFSCWFKPAHFGSHTGRDAILTFGPNQSYQIGDPDTSQPGGGRLMVVSNLNSGSIGPLSDGDLTDVNAWYHIVIINESSTSRCYINGVKQSNTANSPSGSSNITIGSNSDSSQDDPLLGYLAEVNFLDGTVIGHTTTDGRDIINEFGRFNVDGIWVPKKVDELTAAQYGAKGFRLQFNDTTNLGDDSAPTGGSGHTSTNDMTSAGFTADDDDYNDTPTNNHGTLNSHSTTTGSYQATNLEFETDSHGSWKGGRGTFPMHSGKWYWEVTCGQDDALIGISSNTRAAPGFIGSAGEIAYHDNGQKFNASATGSAYGSTFKSGDVIGVAFDATAGKIWFSVNGTFQASGDPAAGTNAAFTSLADELYVPAIFNASAGTNIKFNFGQHNFSNTPPSGYKALATNNITRPKIRNGEEHFKTLIWSGDNTSPRTITGLDFQPDLIWTKRRTNSSASHLLYDSIREFGSSKHLYTDDADGEGSLLELNTEVGGFVSNNASNGFVLTAGSTNSIAVNGSGLTYVGWCWKAGGAPTADNDNAAGTQQDANSVMVDGIPNDGTKGGFAQGTIAVKKMSVNTRAKFSIVEFTGTNTAGSIPHGLGAVPEWAVIKRTDAGGVWSVYHKSMGNQNKMDLENSGQMSAFGTSNVFWNSTTPTSTLFHLGTGTGGANVASANYIAYIWAPVEGYSKFGEYTANNSSNGVMVPLGFRPAFVMVKKKSGANGSWSIYDNSRSTFNPNKNTLVADGPAVEVVSGNDMDFLSNGFKCRDNGSILNDSGTFLYMAFAEHPFGGENTPPANAY